MVCSALWRADRAAAAGLAENSRGEAYADLGADRDGQDHRGIPLSHRFTGAAGRSERSDAGALSLATAGTVERRAEEFAGAAEGNSPTRSIDSGNTRVGAHG